MRSYFKSLASGTEYAVDILDNTSDEVVLSGNEPFVVTYENGGNLYSPARYSGATINIVTNVFLWRLYASTPQELKVKLRSGNNTLWIGYITPTMYNQSYVNEYETLQIDCVDGLSTLRYIPYTAIPKLVAYKHPNHVWSFWEIIVHCISKANCYNDIYISDSISLYDVRDWGDTWSYVEDDDISKSLYVSESLFWDNDEKKYITCDQVLEAICRYLSLTMVAYGDAVYFINYFAISTNTQYGRYYHHYYDIDASNLTASHEVVDKFDPRTIIGNSHRGASTISLDPVYSKVTVKPQLNILDKLFTDYDDEDKRTIVDLDQTEETVEGDVQVLDFSNPYNSSRFWGLLQLYKMDNWTLYNYPRGWQPGDVPVVIDDPTKYINLTQSVGASLVREMVVEKKKGLAWDIQSLSFSDYLLFRCQDEWYADYTKPYAEVTLDDKAHAVLTAGQEGYLVISGSVYLSNLNNIFFIPPGAISQGQVKEFSLMARLQMWDHYYNGSKWGTEPIDFEIPIHVDNNQMFGNWLNINNTITWLTYRDQLNATGCGIPLPFTQQAVEQQGLGIKNVSAASYNVNAKLTLYPPKRPTGIQDRLTGVFIKDLKCEIKTRTTYTGEVEYKKVNNSSFVDELNEDDMLINTYDHRNQSLSYVSALARENSGTSTERRLVAYINDDAGNIHGPAEQIRVEKLAKLYSKPGIVLECVLSNNVAPYTRFYSPYLDSKSFVVDTQTIDYFNGRTSCKLREIESNLSTLK